MEAKSFVPSGSFIDLLLDAVCVVDQDGCFVFASAACERIFGYTPDEMIGRAMIDLVAPDDRVRTLQAAREIMAGDSKLHFENRYVRKDGRIVHIMWSAHWSDTLQLRIAVARDITERKQAEAMQAALYAISEAAHAAGDLLALFGLIHRIIGSLLPAPHFFVAMHEVDNDGLGFPYYADGSDEAPVQGDAAPRALAAEIVRSRQPLLQSPAQDAPGWLGVPLDSDKGTIGALILKSPPGSAGYSERDKELLQFVSTQVATTIERKQLHARLQYMAQYDALTGLPNRAFLHDRLERALAGARREQGRMSVLYLDLDEFKQVNDALGHAAGDLLLREVADRLKLCVRDSDTVARLGGDEFVVVLVNIRLPEHASMVAEKIHCAVRQPMNIAGRSLSILPSIGIALYPEHGDNAQVLLGHADAAMYSAKRRR